jgi:H+-translocating NAD(P) transhydrogenase subunit alpha
MVVLNMKKLIVWCTFGLSLTSLALAEASSTVPTPQAAQADGHAFDLMTGLFVFMLATFIGLDVIRRVSRLLHTPLMSLTNAISAISVVGAIIVAGTQHPPVFTWIGAIAVAAAVSNIVSGFLITDRMLKMFKKKEGEK